MRTQLRSDPGLAARCHWRGAARLIIAGLVPALSPVAASELDIGLNSDAFRVAFGTPVNESLRLGLGWLHDSSKGDVVHGDLQVTGEALPARQGLVAGLGGRMAWLKGDGSNQDGFALGLGGSFRWSLPQYNRFSVAGELFWAPDLLSGGDAEDYRDAGIRLAYSVIRQADVFVGARYVRAEYKRRPDVHFDTGMHAGLSLRF